MTTPHRGGHIDCSNPIEAAVLMDYWLAALPSADEEAVEQHLMTCDGCGDRLREVIALAEGLRALARSGSLQVVISDQFVKHAAETGLRVREYAPPRGEGVQCTVAADDDLLVARLAVDLTTASRVDLSWCDPRGIEHQRMADIPIRAEAGSVICQQSITWAKASPSATMIARLLAVDEKGTSASSASTRSITRERFLARQDGSCPETPEERISWFLKHPENRRRLLSETLYTHFGHVETAGRSTGEHLQSECRTFRERIGWNAHAAVSSQLRIPSRTPSQLFRHSRTCRLLRAQDFHRVEP